MNIHKYSVKVSGQSTFVLDLFITSNKEAMFICVCWFA